MKVPVPLPSAPQLHALMDAIVQVKFALRQSRSTLDYVDKRYGDGEVQLRTLLRTNMKEIDMALAPWDVL